MAHAAELGLATIIVDHHQAGEVPEAHAVINPNRQTIFSRPAISARRASP
jgi:single-stranded DNA-specific DHH superfamily exonuclease